MKSLFLFFCPVIFLFLVSCSNDNKSATTETDSTSANSDKANSMVDADVQLMEEEVPDHVQEYQRADTLVPDSMKISWFGVLDTVYGHKENGNLIVDGDILFNYPPQGGMKHTTGVGTTTRLWPKTNNVILVPYVISSQYGHPDYVLSAMKMWEGKIKVKFVQRTA